MSDELRNVILNEPFSVAMGRKQMLQDMIDKVFSSLAIPNNPEILNGHPHEKIKPKLVKDDPEAH